MESAKSGVRDNASCRRGNRILGPANTGNLPGTARFLHSTATEHPPTAIAKNLSSCRRLSNSQGVIVFQNGGVCSGEIRCITMAVNRLKPWLKQCHTYSVRAMHLILQQDQPEDYVVATGETHTVGGS